MSGKLDCITVAQQNSRSQIIGWLFFPWGVEAPDKATVSIYRSEVENDSFEFVGKVAASKGWFFDEVALLDRWELSFYKLVLNVDGRTTEYGPVRVSGATDAVGRSMIKHMNTNLRLAGIPVLVYQYLGKGDRCPDCWDPVLRSVTRSNCDSCFGTGFIDGYHSPILTLATMGVQAKQNIVNERIEQEITIEMMFSNYPVLRPGDVVYEIDAGTRYRVQQINPAERFRMLINQVALGYGLQTTDVEQNLPIPDISSLTPVLRRKYAPHRKVSSTDGAVFDNSPFDQVKY